MLRIQRENERITLLVGDRIVWQGSLEEWSKAIASATVRELKQAN